MVKSTETTSTGGTRTKSAGGARAPKDPAPSKALGGRQPVPPQLERYLQELWDRKGTDLLLTAKSPPLLRIDGLLQALEGEAPLDEADTERLISALLSPAMRANFDTSRDVDFSFNWHELGRFRANVFQQRGALAIAMRLIPNAIPTFDSLGFPAVINDFVAAPKGMVLVTGPTGCGKSTSLASMLDHINNVRAGHILTIEDPIEYVHAHKRSAVSQREVGEDTYTFERALRSALRENPDVLLVGEMRDLETIQIALTIAETGHLVFASLHTNDTPQAIDRIVDVFPSERQQQIRIQLANSLTGIVYQQLLPRIGGGRVAAFEVLVATTAVRNLIREGKTGQLRNVLATSQRDGMQTLEVSLAGLVKDGTITMEDALSRSLYPADLKRAAAVAPVEERGKRRGRR